jgi:hypothetical protein
LDHRIPNLNDCLIMKRQQKRLSCLAGSCPAVVDGALLLDTGSDLAEIACPAGQVATVQVCS